MPPIIIYKNREQVGFREVAILVGAFLVTLDDGALLDFVPAERRLPDAFGVLPGFDLAGNFVLD